jgi:hypothetical protein
MPSFAWPGLIKENIGMTRFAKILLISALAGTLGLVGCSDDGGDGGSAGSGGSGGTAGGNGGGGNGGQPPDIAECGEGEEIDDSYTIDAGEVSCDALGAVVVPIQVRLGAKSGEVADDTDVDVRVSLDLDEDTVASLGALVQFAVLGEASGEVSDVPETASANVAATTPCSVDFTADSNDNGTPGPLLVTTPAVVQTWPAVDGSIVVEVSDITFEISSPVPLTLTTAGEDAPCEWVTNPTVTLPPAI